MKSKFATLHHLAKAKAAIEELAEGQLLRGVDGPLAEALVGFEVAFVAPVHVVLRRGTARVDLAPSRPALGPPAELGLSLPPDVEAHAVGIYLSSRADGVVTVEVDRPGPPVLTRVNDYGEKYLSDYPGRSGGGPGVRELVRELTGKDPASFQGAERGDHYRIGPPAPR